MLSFILQKYPVTDEIRSVIQEEISSYQGLLVSYGALARKGHILYFDSGSGAICMGGILASPDALQVVNRCTPHIADSLRRIEKLAGRKPDTSLSEVVSSDDLRYCDCKQYTKLTLCCDVLFGISPLLCNDSGALVARCRIQASEALQGMLWEWDVQYDRIYSCWLTGAQYEDWAAGELTNPKSELNQLGTNVARAIAKENNCRVDYLPFELEQ